MLIAIRREQQRNCAIHLVIDRALIGVEEISTDPRLHRIKEERTIVIDRRNIERITTRRRHSDLAREAACANDVLCTVAGKIDDL